MKENKPFIHRGNLTDEQLCVWLDKVSDKISLKIELSREIGRLAESVVKTEKKLNETNTFLDASIRQNIQDSTLSYEMDQARI